MNIQAILLALHLGAGHRIVTIQSWAGEHFNGCQLDSVSLLSGTIRLWVGEKLTTVKATDVAAIHVSDLERSPLAWIDDELLERAA